MLIFRKFYLTLSALVIFMVLCTTHASSQSRLDGDIHSVVRSDGIAYIYHGQTIPLSHGFFVERSTDGNNWERLNEEAHFPASSAGNFQLMLGENYELATELANSDNPQATFLRLRSSQTGLIAAFMVPEIALATGHLYIDEKAPVGQNTYYRFVIVDDMEEPTGDKVEGRTPLNFLEIPTPTNLTLSNESKQVTAQWDYVENTDLQARNVVRFQLYYKLKNSDQLHKAHDGFLVRTTGDTQFFYTFDVPELEKEYEFVVHAIDFTGQMSPPSSTISLLVKENTAPDIVGGVRARELPNYTSEITWPVSPEPDLAGYHVYRARADEEEYVRITDELLEPLQTSYVDTNLEPGSQYRFRVTAVDENGNESEKSNPAHVFMADERVPESITSLNAHFDNNQVLLNWSEPEVPAGFRTYFLLRRQIFPSAGGGFTRLTDQGLQETSFEDQGVSNEGFLEGAVYEYGVGVIGENGISSDTVYASVSIPKVTPPEPPTFIKADMQQGQRVGLTWNASGSTDAAWYRIYRNDGHTEDSLLVELPYWERVFRDENVELGKEFIYRVTSVDTVGNESENFATDTLTTRRLNPPAPARNVQAIQINQQIQLAWEPTNDNQVTGYRIYKSPIATGVFEVIGELKEAETAWIDPNGTPGEWYKVFPIDATGREAPTAKATQALIRQN